MQVEVPLWLGRVVNAVRNFQLRRRRLSLVYGSVGMSGKVQEYVKLAILEIEDEIEGNFAAVKRAAEEKTLSDRPAKQTPADRAIKNNSLGLRSKIKARAPVSIRQAEERLASVGGV